MNLSVYPVRGRLRKGETSTNQTKLKAERPVVSRVAQFEGGIDPSRARDTGTAHDLRQLHNSGTVNAIITPAHNERTERVKWWLAIDRLTA
jgi:hypothetical protein